MTVPTSRSPILWRTDPPPPRSPARSFLPLLRAAVASHPGRPDLLRDLAVALRDDRQWEEALDLLSPLAQGGGLTPALACELARAALARDRPELALNVVDAAIAGAVPGARRQQVLALYALDRIDEARAAAARALDEEPGDGAVLDAFANDCLKHGATDVLAARCRREIDRGAGSSKYLAYLATTLAMDGRTPDAARLVSPVELCGRTELGSGQVDNDELVEAILTHPALAQSSPDKPTHGRNLRLEGLAGLGHPAIRNLFSIVRQQVDAYLADRLASSHPVIVHRPKTMRLEGWALVLSDDGHEETHIHQRGWLSAVYYARVPPPSPRAMEGGGPPPGSLVFGPWPPSIGASLPDFPRWHVEPKMGTLLIFPSFLGHETVPTDVGDPRICVAFDIVPCAPAPLP